MVFASGKDRIFCSGANIYMLGASGHGFKVNFCKFTNETRLYLEEIERRDRRREPRGARRHRVGRRLRARARVRRDRARGRRVERRELPEAPLLGVLPGTGGLTRLVDKRQGAPRPRGRVLDDGRGGARQARARVGARRRGADRKREFEAAVRRRLDAMVARSRRRAGKPIVARTARRVSPRVDRESTPPDARGHADGARARREPSPRTPRSWRVPARTRGPSAHGASSTTRCSICASTTRNIGVVALKTTGDRCNVLAVDAMLAQHQDDGLVREVTLLMKRVLKRLDNTAKSVLRADRARAPASPARWRSSRSPPTASYMLDDPDRETSIHLSAMNAGLLPMSNGLTRLASRFLASPERDRARPRARRARSTRRTRSPRASSRSRPTTSTGTTRYASPSRSAPASRPTR